MGPIAKVPIVKASPKVHPNPLPMLLSDILLKSSTNIYTRINKSPFINLSICNYLQVINYFIRKRADLDEFLILHAIHKHLSRFFLHSLESIVFSCNKYRYNEEI